MAGVYATECPPGGEDADSWIRRGMVCTRRRKYATAIESFGRALDHDPGSVEALLGRGNALYALERYDEALAAYDRALEAAPDRPAVHLARSSALSALGRHGGGRSRVRPGDGPPPPPRTGVIYRTSARTPNRPAMTEGYPTATVDGREVPYDPSTLRRIQEHPCFSEKACHAFGRMHLAVAPKCNIQCNYCQRDYDCVNESRPGVTSRIVTPEEAVALVKQVLDEHTFIKVIGIAGPGDPLANEQTFEALRLVKEHFPETIRCISTNGLMLPERIDELAALDVGNITVTMNALDPEVGAKIYDHVDYHGKRYEGVEAAKILIANQLKGVEEAVKHKMIVKINTVWVPGINDDEIVEIAETTSKLGAYTFNLIPVIPQYKFKDVVPPTPAEKRAMQDRCAPYIKQMRHCQRCRADAIGMLGHDLQTPGGCSKGT